MGKVVVQRVSTSHHPGWPISVLPTTLGCKLGGLCPAVTVSLTLTPTPDTLARGSPLGGRHRRKVLSEIQAASKARTGNTNFLGKVWVAGRFQNI